MVLILLACGGGGGGAENSSSAVNSGGDPTPASNTATLIGPPGGTATSADGTATIQLPAGALTANTAITIAQLPTNVPQGNIGNVFDFGPNGTAFSKPVTIRIKFDPNLIPQGVTESSLTLASVSGSTWIDISTTVDTVNKLLVGQATHFSTYGWKIADTNKLPYGSLIGSTPNGVNVYSNGCIDPTQTCAANPCTYPDTYNTDNAGGYNSGIQWQCVEFINRYYYQIYDKDIRVGGGNAKDYFSNTLANTKGLVKYLNDGSGLPQIGDIVVSVGNGINVGHVAIVTSIGANYVHLAEQNWHEGLGDLDHVLAIKSGNIVADFSSSYPTTGWLRLPVASLTIPSEPTGFTVTTSSSSEVDLSWTASTGTVTGYKVYKNGSLLKTVTTTPTSDTGLSAATNYCYSVTAYNAAGESEQTSQLCATTSSTPTYSISGSITHNGSGLAGVTVSLSGMATAQTMTDGSGYYIFNNLQNGSYIVTPTISGYSLNPTSRTVEVNSTSASQAFTATSQVTLPFGYVVQGGLTWMPNGLDTPARTLTFSAANAYCTDTTINGQTGWRLPTQAELIVLYESGAMNPQGSLMDQLQWPWVLSWTWSSTPGDNSIFDNTYIIVKLNNGDYQSLPPDYSILVTCVR
jgi:hypothetical protein